MVSINIKKISVDKITMKPCIVFSTTNNTEIQWSLPITIKDAVHLSAHLYPKKDTEAKISFVKYIVKKFVPSLSYIILSTVDNLTITPIGIYSSLIRTKKLSLSIPQAFSLALRQHKKIFLDSKIIPLLEGYQSMDFPWTLTQITKEILDKKNEIKGYYNIENLEPETTVYM